MQINTMIQQAKELVIADKYNNRDRKRCVYSPITKGSVVRMTQLGVRKDFLAKELGLSEGTVYSWTVLYKDFNLTNDIAFAEFLGLFDGRQMKHKASQRRSNYEETRRVKEVTLTKEQSPLAKLIAERNAYQKKADRLTKQIKVLELAKMLQVDICLK